MSQLEDFLKLSDEIIRQYLEDTDRRLLFGDREGGRILPPRRDEGFLVPGGVEDKSETKITEVKLSRRWVPDYGALEDDIIE